MWVVATQSNSESVDVALDDVNRRSGRNVKYGDEKYEDEPGDDARNAQNDEAPCLGYRSSNRRRLLAYSNPVDDYSRGI